MISSGIKKLIAKYKSIPAKKKKNAALVGAGVGGALVAEQSISKLYDARKVGKAIEKLHRSGYSVSDAQKIAYKMYSGSAKEGDRKLKDFLKKRR